MNQLAVPAKIGGNEAELKVNLLLKIYCRKEDALRHYGHACTAYEMTHVVGIPTASIITTKAKLLHQRRIIV